MSFRKMKIKINSPEHSEAVQKRLFELGYSWSGSKTLRRSNICGIRSNICGIRCEEDSSLYRTSDPDLYETYFTDRPWVDILAEEKESPSEKPPIGLTPEFIWKSNVEQARVAEIVEAIQRYKREEKVVPLSWIDELKKLVC